MSKFTVYGWSLAGWTLLNSFQYGFHISALNQLQAVLTCKVADTEGPMSTPYGLPTCVPMSDATFSVVTAVFTIGGLLGSMGANVLIERRGRRSAVRAAALLNLLGAGLMTVSSTVSAFIIGRILVGMAAGIGLCVGPIYLSEIAPAAIRGNVGVLTQLAIVFGIMITQSMGLRLATPHSWRLVLLFSSALGAFQLVSSLFAVESPAWGGDKQTRAQIERRLWGAEAIPSRVFTADDEDPLLNDDDASSQTVRPAAPAEETVSVPRLLFSRELRRPLMIISLAMSAQQLSGINAVLYYSNDILSSSLPDLGPYVSLGITIVNTLMTFPPIILIERMGRKPLLQISIGGALISLACVGIGLNSGAVTLASVAIVTFVMSFAIGLGPVPFVMISEVAPAHATSALSSVALSLNWTSNFLVGLIFLPLRNALSAHGGEGTVFFVFVGILGVVSLSLFRLYRG